MDHDTDLADRSDLHFRLWLSDRPVCGTVCQEQDLADSAFGFVRHPLLDVVLDTRDRVAAYAGKRGRHQYHSDEVWNHSSTHRGPAVHRTFGGDRHDPDLCGVHGRTH